MAGSFLLINDTDFLLINDADFLLINDAGDRLIISDDAIPSAGQTIAFGNAMAQEMTIIGDAKG